ncbi:hypothetical protein NC651_029400 [Populus alba x Populus x berolinensis]|nr:hypothetical protein NC651_029400 [Populus alba x Populus x berolinensis]
MKLNSRNSLDLTFLNMLVSTASRAKERSRSKTLNPDLTRITLGLLLNSHSIVGDEGGFAPNIQENKEVLELLKTAIAKAGYTGNEFYNNDDNTYDLNFKEENNDGSQKISGDSLKNVYKSFVTDYPIVSIEDPFDQDDWEHYAKMTSEIGSKCSLLVMISLSQTPR